MGRDVYEAAITNPDSLADVVDPEIEAEAETYASAFQAWVEVTGESDRANYSTPEQHRELQGEEWDFTNHAETRRRLPRLDDLYPSGWD